MQNLMQQPGKVSAVPVMPTQIDRVLSTLLTALDAKGTRRLTILVGDPSLLSLSAAKQSIVRSFATMLSNVIANRTGTAQIPEALIDLTLKKNRGLRAVTAHSRAMANADAKQAPLSDRIRLFFAAAAATIDFEEDEIVLRVQVKNWPKWLVVIYRFILTLLGRDVPVLLSVQELNNAGFV